MGLSIDAIQERLDDVDFRPFALEGWTFEGKAIGDTLAITLTNHFARDSAAYDWDADTDDWTMLDARSQEFTRSCEWPGDLDELCLAVVELVCWASAHEALEWLRIDGSVPHDPHVDGEPIVKLP